MTISLLWKLRCIWNFLSRRLHYHLLPACCTYTLFLQFQFLHSFFYILTYKKGYQSSFLFKKHVWSVIIIFNFKYLYGLNWRILDSRWWSIYFIECIRFIGLHWNHALGLCYSATNLECPSLEEKAFIVDETWSQNQFIKNKNHFTQMLIAYWSQSLPTCLKVQSSSLTMYFNYSSIMMYLVIYYLTLVYHFEVDHST